MDKYTMHSNKKYYCYKLAKYGNVEYKHFAIENGAVKGFESIVDILNYFGFKDEEELNLHGYYITKEIE